ncbi:MAG: bacteriohemerythrin [Bryobacteraceae bacterium]
MATTTTQFVSWNDTWLVGVQEVDAQHKHLVSLLNQLHEAMSQGHGKDVLGPILDSLVRYTQVHFAAEERMMQQSNYPDIVNHKREHEALTQKVLDFQKNFTDGRIAMGIEVMQFLSTWLQGHIRGTDKKYVPFMHASGIR